METFNNKKNLAQMKKKNQGEKLKFLPRKTTPRIFFNSMLVFWPMINDAPIPCVINISFQVGMPGVSLQSNLSELDTLLADLNTVKYRVEQENR